MNREGSTAALIIALPLLSCGHAPDATRNQLLNDAAEEERNGRAAPASASGNSVDAPGLAPPDLTPEAEEGVKGARNILLTFARAIELGRYGQAWSLLSAADRKRWSAARFAAVLSGLNGITVAVADGAMERVPGSTHYTAPVAVTGQDADGRPVRVEGTAVLRRADDVGDAARTRRRWRFEALTLDWTH